MGKQCVVITGASEGIGRALAESLSTRGVDLVLAARNPTALERVAQNCATAGSRAVAVPTDVADPAACQRLVDRALEVFGGIDVLVNNAGVSMQARLDAVTDLGIFERIMRVNYLGAVYCTHAALPHLRKRRGLVVAISSLQGKTGFPTYSGYAASKHAMQGFFDSLRIELFGSGVDVLVVSPGPVATNVHAHRLRGDGTLGTNPGPMPASAMPVEECARQIVRAIDRRDRELVMTPLGRLGVWLKVVAPALVDRMVARAVERFDAGREGRSERSG
jgi:short-subunit dehydrogenase